MFRNLGLSFLIIASSSAFAAPGLDVRPGVDFQDTEEMNLIQELVPVSEALKVEAQCVGRIECTQFVDMDTCLDLGEPIGCFWSAE